jgi:uncharacterized protein (DUF305 family)
MYCKRFTLSVLAISTVGFLLAGCGNNDGDTATEGESTSTEAAFNTADVEFAQQMIPHHTQAVQMAQMVPDEDVTPALTELADAVEAAQQPEIDQLTAMLARWGKDVPSTGMDGHDMGDMQRMGMMSAEDMDALGAATGTGFERMWLTMMIDHHQGAIAMADAELDGGSDQEALTLAQTIIDAQTAEITQMEQMLQALGS